MLSTLSPLRIPAAAAAAAFSLPATQGDIHFPTSWLASCTSPTAPCAWGEYEPSNRSSAAVAAAAMANSNSNSNNHSPMTLSRAQTPDFDFDFPLPPGSWPRASPVLKPDNALLLPESLRIGLARLPNLNQNLSDPPNTPVTPSRPSSPAGPVVATAKLARVITSRPRRPSNLRRLTRPPSQTQMRSPPHSPTSPRSPRSPGAQHMTRVVKRTSLTRPVFHRKSSSGPTNMFRAFELRQGEPRRAISAREADEWPAAGLKQKTHRKVASASHERLATGYPRRQRGDSHHAELVMGGPVGGFQARAVDGAKDDGEWVEEPEWLDEPMSGLSSSARVQRTLQSKRLDQIKFVDFGERSLPRTPLSVSLTPRELYHSQQSRGVYTPPSTNEHSPTSPQAPRAEPVRPARPQRPVLGAVTSSVAEKVKGSPFAFPLTPIAMDLASLSVIAGLSEVGSLSVEPGLETPPPPYSASPERSDSEQSPTSAKSSDTNGTTRIRLRTGSVVTVAPPEQTAWQRRVYLAGPIRLGKETDGFKGRSRLKSLVRMDALVENVDIGVEERMRKNSEDEVLDELVDYFSAFGFCDLDSELDQYWSMGGQDPPSPPPEKPMPPLPVLSVERPVSPDAASPGGQAQAPPSPRPSTSGSRSMKGSFDSRSLAESMESGSSRGMTAPLPPLPLPSEEATTQKPTGRQRLRRLMKSAGSVL